MHITRAYITVSILLIILYSTLVVLAISSTPLVCITVCILAREYVHSMHNTLLYLVVCTPWSIIQNQCTMPFHTKLLLISFSFFAVLLYYYLMHFEISETGNNVDKLSNPSWYFRNWTVAMGKTKFLDVPHCWLLIIN